MNRLTTLKHVRTGTRFNLCKTGCLLVYAAIIVLLLPAQSRAQMLHETLYDVYRISSEASVEVDNDLMVATLTVQEEDKDAAALANKVNATMSWAVDVLEPFSAIAVRTRDYQTYPRYENSSTRRLIGWRAQQSIELETDDFTAAGKAIQQLQEKLIVQSIDLSVKPATREKASGVLVENALNSFKDRAALVQRNMNSASYRILDVDIRTQHSGPEYDGGVRTMSMESSSYSRSVESAPVIAAGSTTVVVQINGRIQLD